MNKDKVWYLAVLSAAFLLLIITLCPSIKANAEEQPELLPVTVTCYTFTGNTTCLGKEPRNGIMAARKEWLGKAALVYERDEDGNIGQLIGIYEILDTGVGKNGAIQKGYVVDIFYETDEDFIPTQKAWIQLVDAVG